VRGTPKEFQKQEGKTGKKVAFFESGEKFTRGVGKKGGLQEKKGLSDTPVTMRLKGERETLPCRG